jgi:hypothetical protein
VKAAGSPRSAAILVGGREQVEYIRITSIDDPHFAQMHKLMQQVFPPEEVLAFDLWREPLQDQGLRVYVAVHEGEVVGATEYRFLPKLQVAMTDFTIIGRAGLGIGRFLWQQREADLRRWAQEAHVPMLGMFAEVYNPGEVSTHDFGGIAPMHPMVRREVLSHMGYKRLDFAYVHPSWQNDGEAVGGLDLCFLPADPAVDALPAQLVADFLTTYYAVLPNKPAAWHAMIDNLRQTKHVWLRPL